MFCASGCWCSSTHGKHTTTSRIYETLCYFLELMRASIFPMWFSCVHNQPFVLLRFHGWEQSQLESVHEKKGKKTFGNTRGPWRDRDASVVRLYFAVERLCFAVERPYFAVTHAPPQNRLKIGWNLKKTEKAIGDVFSCFPRALGSQPLAPRWASAQFNKNITMNYTIYTMYLM